MRLATPALLLILLALPLRAQTPGACAEGTATATLDANDVAAAVFNTGSLFFGGHNVQNAYFVPKAEGKSPVYAASLWVAGTVGGELRVAAATYQDFEFWPGPLADGGTLPNPTDCSAFDHIWSVSRADMLRYLETGVATADLADWPVALGAEVLDGDGDSANYNLAGGDQPAIRGDQTLFWVMNDVGNVHNNSLTLPLGLEVRVTAFAAADSTSLPVHQATLYRYEFVNRNAQPIESLYAGIFADTDLGHAIDDFVGSDTTLSLGYTYNADNADGDGDGLTYGTPPPAFGIAVLDGPLALADGRDNDQDGTTDERGERLGLTSFFTYTNSSGSPGPPCPSGGQDIPLVLRGRHCDGSPMRMGGNGYGGDGPITTFAYPADPVTGQFWSERNTGDDLSTPGDRRIIVSMGPFRLEPGARDTVTVALVYGRGSNNLTSVTALRAATRVVRFAHGIGHFDPQRVTVPPPTPTVPDVPAALTLTLPAPNPFTDEATVRYTLPAAMPVRLAVYDALGRAVAVLVDGEQAAGTYARTLDGRSLAPGVYIGRFTAAGATRTFRLTKLR